MPTIEELIPTIEELKQRVQADPRNAEKQIILGCALINAHRHEEAIPPLSIATVLDPQSPDAHLHLGIAYYRQKQFKNATESLQECLNLDIGIMKAHYFLGLALTHPENESADLFQQGIDHLETAADNTLSNFDYQFEAAQACLIHQKTERAARYFVRATQTNPSDREMLTQAHLEAAKVLQLQDPPNALKHAKIAFEGLSEISPQRTQAFVIANQIIGDYPELAKDLIP